jgi:LacI family transcriptional regulator
VVIVNRRISCTDVDLVLTDNALGGRLATQHLIELGHRRIACITGPSDITPGSERVVGYRQALQEANILFDETLTSKANYRFNGGFDAARKLLSSKNPPTAIFACNDLMAVGAIRAAHELGYSVPSDLSVVGYDDVNLASFTTPPLTTILQPKYDIGVMAATMLLERMRNSALPERKRVPEIKLLVRRSTAPPRTSLEIGLTSQDPGAIIEHRVK